MTVAFVWNQDIPRRLEYGAHIGTATLHMLTGHDLLVWTADPPPTLGDYALFFVNLFDGMHHVTQIKTANPGAQVVAVPDAYMDEVFLNRDWRTEALYLEQLQAADAIAVVSESNRQFYAALFDKPVYTMPLGIGYREYFADLRGCETRDYVLVVDHSPRAVEWSIQNIAALALFQRYCSAKIIYVNPAPNTRRYADALNIDIHFAEYTVYASYVRLAARARCALDLHALYGFGRNEITLAYVGTPIVGSTRTEALALDMCCEPFYAEQAAHRLLTLWQDAALRAAWAEQNVTFVEQHYSFEAAADQMRTLIKEVQCNIIPS